MNSDSTVSPVSSSSSLPASMAAPVSRKHPWAFMFFFWGEFAERSSFYGMRAIMPLYLTNVLLMEEARSAPIYFYFKMACYLLPLLGGYLADRFFGRYWTIVGFSIPYVLGHFILGIPNEIALVIALVLLAGGSGVIKPNISSLMGETYDQQRPGQSDLRSAAFMWFYFAINFGALISQLVLPIIRTKYGYTTAFQFPAWLMVVSLGVFALGKPFYTQERQSVRKQLTPGERAERRAAFWRLSKLFGLFIFFWMAYEQNDSLWVYFIRDYVNLKVDFGLARLQDNPLLVAPDQLQFLNALCVLILIPLFRWSFGKLDPNVRIFTPGRKILAGFIATTLAVSIMSAAGFLATAAPGDKLSLLWPAMAYIMLTVGEVLLYGTGLELAYALAPASLKGFVTACFLLTSTLGNLINSQLSPWYGGVLNQEAAPHGLLPGPFFLLTAAITAAATAAFYFVGQDLARLPPPAGERSAH